MVGASAALVAWVATEEGFRARPYRDTTGHLTVGYGLNLDAGITEPEAAAILRLRLAAVQHDLLVRCPWLARLDDVRRGVLTAMAYQMGVPGLLRFAATLAAVERGDYDEAARRMLASRWATQTPQRAKRSAEAMRTGEWP